MAAKARQAELDVYAELEIDGRQAIVRRNAARLQAATDLFWNAVQKAAQDNDLDRLDHYVSRFGWLAGASLRAWAQVKIEEERPGTPVDVQAVLTAVRSSSNEE
jgi:sigma54-dependent transcription regulator